MHPTKPFLEACASITEPIRDDDVYNELYSYSDEFPIKFPIKSVRCKTLIKGINKSILHKNIESTYPLIHEKVLLLMWEFLLFKREHGYEVEKKLYKNMTIAKLIDRLLKKRSVVFYGLQERYTLLSGDKGMSGWTSIGTPNEKPPLVLYSCLSYDEMKLSALLYVSGETVFINNGSRNNQGIADNPDNVERHGVIIGLIGTQIQRKQLMEYQEIIVDKNQNTSANGYCSKISDNHESTKKLKSTSTEENKHYLWRKIWAEFYDEPSLTYEEASKVYEKEVKKVNRPQRYTMMNDKLFDNHLYSRHISIAFDCALLEASRRAVSKGKMAYLHVVGIGLGVWKAFDHQENLFIKVFLERIKELSPQLSGVSDVHFSYINDITEDVLSPNGTSVECSSHPLGSIKVHLSNREPSSKLEGEHNGKLLVETYAWNGNAQPGNIFWNGSLTSSGDPAAACSSQVAELHNSHINRRFVCAQNAHVAGKHGILHIAEYAKLLLEQ